MTEAEARAALKKAMPWASIRLWSPWAGAGEWEVWCASSRGPNRTFVQGRARTLRAAVNAAIRAWEKAKKA